MNLSLENNWTEIIKMWEQEERSCVRCGSRYKEKDNIGQWKCRVHTSQFNLNAPGEFFEKGRWDCCNRYLRPTCPHWNGCVPADHLGLDQYGIIIPQPYIEVVHRKFIKNNRVAVPIVKIHEGIEMDAQVKPLENSGLKGASAELIYVRRQGDPFYMTKAYPKNKERQVR